MWLAIVQHATFLPSLPHSLPLSAYYYSPSFRGEKAWMEYWKGDERTERGWFLSIFVEFQAQTAAGSCSPATRRKRMKAVMWQHRLILIIICFSISSGTPHSFAQKCFSNRLPSSFHAIVLCNIILPTTLSHYFQIYFIPIWADLLSWRFISVCSHHWICEKTVDWLITFDKISTKKTPNNTHIESSVNTTCWDWEYVEKVTFTRQCSWKLAHRRIW